MIQTKSSQPSTNENQKGTTKIMEYKEEPWTQQNKMKEKGREIKKWGTVITRALLE